MEPTSGQVLTMVADNLVKHDEIAKIKDEDLRRSFPENVAPHHELVSEFGRLRANG